MKRACSEQSERKPKPARAWLAAIAAIGISGTAQAAGWQELHESSDDVHIDVDRAGIATVNHHLRYRVVAGHFKTFELAGIDPSGKLTSEATFTSEKGNSDQTPARVEPVPKTPGSIRIVIDEGKGLGRGSYVVDVTYRLDMVATKMLTRDGALWKLAWTAPAALEGHDGARVIFGVPSAPTEPRLAGEATTTLATLRRTAEKDELELVRPHIPRGEAAVWAIRVDPKGFAKVSSPELRPVAIPEEAPESFIVRHLARIIGGGLLLALSLGLAFLLRAKQEAVRSVAKQREARVDAVLALPWGLGPWAYGFACAGALASLLWWSPIAGALLIVVALALAAHRPPRPIAKPRGPGSWRPVSDGSVLVPLPTPPLATDALDIGARRGALTLAALAAFVLAGCFALHTRVPQIALALPLTFAAVLPIFASGTRAQLFPTPAELAARLLRPARDALASKIDLAHVEIGTIGRVVGEEVDEVRLSCAPRDRTPGFRAIELAVAACAGGYAAVPEILLRYDAGSAAAQRIARLVPTQSLAGRNPDEKVVRLVPEESTAAAAADLVGRLLSALEDRRGAARNGAPSRWRGVERRAAAMC